MKNKLSYAFLTFLLSAIFFAHGVSAQQQANVTLCHDKCGLTQRTHSNMKFPDHNTCFDGCMKRQQNMHQ